MYRWTVLILVIVLTFLVGCASGPHARAKKLLEQQDYAGAAEVLQIALSQSPDNPDIMVDLAEAFYHQNELNQAEKFLKQARSLDPANGRASLILGLVHEKRGDRKAAIAAYRSYAQMGRLSRTRGLIKARLDRLVREQIQEETRSALAREQLLDVAAIPDNAIAIAPFRNLSSNPSLDPLRKGLAEMMVTDLSKVSSLQVVERLRMQEMMKEIGLGMTGAVDPATAPRLGKLLGANRVVAGSFADLADDQLRLDISIAGVKTGEVEASETSGPLDKLFRLQKELTFGIVGEMGIRLTEEERDAIQELPTENMLAFIAYSKGLDLEDQGQTEAAAEAFQEAVSLDPQFEVAQESVERVEGASLGAASMGNVETEIFGEEAVEEAEEQTSGTTESETLSRLGATGANTGAGFIATGESGESDVRKAAQERKEAETVEMIPIKVVMPVPDIQP
jgi:TolB-like protein